MKNYFKRFKFLYITVAILLVIYLIVALIHKSTQEVNVNNKENIRTNAECLTDERVFDYGDKLSDDEEQSLRELITQKEKMISCDIIIVTLDEPMNLPIRDYADQFVEDNKFGYNKPYGNSVIFVANWTKGGDNAWFGTSGSAESRYSVNMINNLIDDVTSNLRNNPYHAFETYINDVYYDFSDKNEIGFKIPGIYVLVIAIIVTIIYLVINLASHKGKRTTNASTYVEGGVPNLKRKDDVFVTKNIVSRKIETSSGNSGGGGHHVSSGGHSHGGGGGRF